MLGPITESNLETYGKEVKGTRPQALSARGYHSSPRKERKGKIHECKM